MKEEIQFFVLIAVLVGVGLAVGGGKAQQAGKHVSIVLTEKGFEPAQVTIAKGTTVVFATTRGKHFWPASNLHPTHELYSEFDPKEPVSPDKSWSFRFDKAGTWKFHDHITPYYTGEIRVTDEAGRSAGGGWLDAFLWRMNFSHNEDKAIIECLNLTGDRGTLQECWGKAIPAYAKRYGANEALNRMEKLQGESTSFAADCHAYAHRVGEEAYWQFVRSRRFKITDNTSLCNQGFYHGFMQEFASHNENLDKAKALCEEVKTETAKAGSVNRDTLVSQCYHGIGHGLTFYYATQNWGDQQAMVSKAIDDCGRYAKTGDYRECVNGVFGGIDAMYWGLHGLKVTLPADDPFALCHSQKEEFQPLCYNSLIPPLYHMMGMDLVKAGQFVAKIQNSDARRISMEHLGSMPSHDLVPKTEDYSDMVVKCRAFGGDLTAYCLNGFAKSLVYIGDAVVAAKRAVRFCENGKLTAGERDGCEYAVTEMLRYTYDKDGVTTLCRKDKEIEAFCRKRGAL